MAIHFSNVLGIVWICASYGRCKKLIALECLWLPILFPYHGILLSTCFWNCKYLSIVIIVNILKRLVLESSTWQRVRDNFSRMRPLKYIVIMYIMFVHAQSQQRNAEAKVCWALLQCCFADLENIWRLN